MAATLTVLYPDATDATFDMDYYLSSHMPMVARRFGAHGMAGWRVARIVGTPAGGEAPFSVVATLDFGSVEGIRTALKAEGGPVLGDVPHFSNKEPVIVIGDTVGHG